MTRCMAHRGWSSRAPENTMAAFRLALEEPAIDAIELDVQLSKDGIPVVIHDFVLDRSTSGKGLVRDHTYEQLAQLDAGSWFSQEFAGESIPTLEQVFQAVADIRGDNPILLNLELKQAGELYPGLEEKVAELVNNYQMHSRVVISSFDHDALLRIKNWDATLTTGLLFAGKPTLIAEQMKHTGAEFLSMAYPYITKELAKWIISQGRMLVAWTVDPPQMMEMVIGIHPEIVICTNAPENLFALKKQNGY